MYGFFGREVTQWTLLLRMFCGGYLAYLSWELRDAVFCSNPAPLYVFAALVFAGVGLPLCLVSLKRLIRMEYTFLPNQTLEHEEEPSSQDQEP